MKKFFKHPLVVSILTVIIIGATMFFWDFGKDEAVQDVHTYYQDSLQNVHINSIAKRAEIIDSCSMKRDGNIHKRIDMYQEDVNVWNKALVDVASQGIKTNNMLKVIFDNVEELKIFKDIFILPNNVANIDTSFINLN